jgi:flagellar motility protein MotE (MotC chaperone)
MRVAMPEIALDLLRQFPLLAVTLLVVWYYTRIVTRQHERELAAKEQEIARLLDEKQKEIERLLEERRKYFQLFLKEIQPQLKKPKDE